jgi:hypothetical protein
VDVIESGGDAKQLQSMLNQLRFLYGALASSAEGAPLQRILEEVSRRIPQ